jgi:hypothetical protein
MRSSSVVGLCTCGVAIAASSCGSSHPLASSGPAAAQLTVYVVEPPPNPYDDLVPLPGAHVVVDPPGGGARVTADADADGKATFAGVDLSKGPVTVTAFAAGHTMVTLFDVTPDIIANLPLTIVYAKGGGNLVLGVPPLAFPTPLDLKGTIKGKTTDTDTVTLSTTTAQGQFQSSHAGFHVAVQKGKAASLVGLEWTPVKDDSPTGGSETNVKWARLDAPAMTADGTLDFDFATASPIVPTKVSGKLARPGGATGPFGQAVPTWQVAASEGTFLGSRTTVTVAADGASFDYTGEYVSVTGTHPLFQALLYADATKDSFALLQGETPPADGETIDGFLSIPATPGATSIGAPVALSGIAPDAKAVGLVVFATGGVTPLWVATWPLGGVSAPATLTLPAVPEGAAGLLGTGGLQGAVEVLGAPFPNRATIATKVSISKRVAISR